MSIAHFLIFSADPSATTNNGGEFPEQEISALAALPGVERVDRYEPTEFADDPYDDDRQGQVLTYRLFTATLQAWRRAWHRRRSGAC